jgi:hypothetical protein
MVIGAAFCMQLRDDVVAPRPIETRSRHGGDVHLNGYDMVPRANNSLDAAHVPKQADEHAGLDGRCTEQVSESPGHPLSEHVRITIADSGGPDPASVVQRALGEAGRKHSVQNVLNAIGIHIAPLNGIDQTHRGNITVLRVLLLA